MQDKNEIYKFFADLIYNKTGIFYPEKDFYRLDARLNTLCKAYSCEDYISLYMLFSTKMNSLMERDLINLATNNETFFFRDKKPFNFLSSHIFPQAKGQGKMSFNIWSCACSSGQEPYSIKMEYLEKGFNNDFKLEITATDISSEILDKAKSGVYSSLEVQRGLPIQLMVKYFFKNDDSSWKVNDDLKKDVSFSYFNILKDVYPVNKYDVIFCRNVLIYQDKKNKQEIVKNLFHALKPGGFLIFGAGESLIGFDHSYKQEVIEGCMIFIKPDQSSQEVA